ncbi:UPF0182 family protein [Candidatus Woesearchaeota archaeon]|nr:UPF0182 family protein [Candidatus Woesearchaeota archaeon]
MANKNILQSTLLFLIVIFLFSVSGLAKFFTDYLWFDALGFSQIFLTIFKSKIILFLIGALTFISFSSLNLWVASKLNKIKGFMSFKVKSMILLIISFIMGVSVSSNWLVVLQYINQFPFNLKDPIFLRDVGFYVFSLPLFLIVWKFIIISVVITIFLVILHYLQSIKFDFGITDIHTGQVSGNSMSVKKIFDGFKKNSMIHLSVLGSLLFILLAVRHYLSRFSIMYSEAGIVVGAGYTDVVAYLPIVKLLMILAIVIAALFIVWVFYFSKNPKLKKRHILMYGLIIYFLFAFVGSVFIPGLVQSLKVEPNEINLEKPYIENNIKFTRIAYGLSDVEEKDFSVEMNLDSQVISEATGTIDNIRILDWRPLIQTYKQTQEIRLYYDLSGIDIDRYTIDGKYTQVMIAPRELEQAQITQDAKTWVNLHMVYSHGFGVVMSPVNSVTSEGLPNFFIKDIPPVYSVNDSSLKISQPRIYYGEKDNDFVLVNTKTDEFDYPKGNKNKYINYDGVGGVKLDSFFKKVLMALRFGDIKILLSSDINDESKIMFTRNIQQRISKITPFLKLDRDPYLVVNDEKLFWIQDAYTVSNNFPYSEKSGPINYIRNSVKIVVSAYDGDVNYYVSDVNDPLIITYTKIFPKQFKSIDSMPEGLKKHIRYPTDLFSVQSKIYSTYHMDDVPVFYNKEDAWQIPKEIYGVGQQIMMEPYYMIMKLPGEEKEEFVLMTPFTPIRKDNMVAWMAARSDFDDYGKLILYKFPKDKLIYGPSQIEAKFDQDSEISQQLTLWSQQGSRITRGNLLVIPIEDSILYVEPLYIQAETGQLPELKRVLMSDGERVVMEKDIGSALIALFGTSTSTNLRGAQEVVEGEEASILEDKSQEELIEDANNYYGLILDSMNQQDWSGIGNNFDKLGEVLSNLAE